MKNVGRYPEQFIIETDRSIQLREEEKAHLEWVITRESRRTPRLFTLFPFSLLLNWKENPTGKLCLFSSLVIM